MGKNIKIAVIPEPGCGCFESEDMRNNALTRVIAVAANITHAMFKMCIDESLCFGASKLVMHEIIMAATTIFMSEDAPGIELGSQEALWESERQLAGIEQRLIDGLRLKYQMYNDLTPEKQKESREFFGELSEKMTNKLDRSRH
jgi:hypothetical protein